MNKKTLNMLELDIILARVAEYAVLDDTKTGVLDIMPVSDLAECRRLLDITKEADLLIYNYGVNEVLYFHGADEELNRAKIYATLNFKELLNVAFLLKSARLAKSGINAIDDSRIKYLKEYAANLLTDAALEKEIFSKILSEDKIADNASDELYSIKRRINKLNQQIREKLQNMLRGESGKYLQDGIITMRGDRYVVPVKSEHRGQVRGLIHDQSSSGATVYIEPEAVLELNNQLKLELLAEKNEIEKILRELTAKIAPLCDGLFYNQELLRDIDTAYAKAVYAYKNKCVCPKINKRGAFNIIKGRHPLIDAEKVVPLTLGFGENNKFLLLTGPNTGGKTVCLKLVGLFSAMSMCGLFIPAADGTEVSVFDNIFCDIGDEQSIAQSLSTFSSHMTNIINILENLNGISLVLIDEIGAGTDPEEGSVLALSVISELLENNAYGIITTHFNSLKEYAFLNPKITNACMDFDNKTFAPLYKINIGMPGSSNAVEISKRLGLSAKITDRAYSYLSENKISFDKVLRKAEETRINAERETAEVLKIKTEKEAELAEVKKLKESLQRERENTLKNAKIESRRIINNSVAEAEEIIIKLQEKLKQAEVGGGDIIEARTLKNKLEDKKFEVNKEQPDEIPHKKIIPEKLKEGDCVYVKNFDCKAVVSSVNLQKGEAEIMIGGAKSKVKLSELFFVKSKDAEKESGDVTFSRKAAAAANVSTEINLIGKTSDEAIYELDAFLDGAYLNNVKEVRIIHGFGALILKNAVQRHLKDNVYVKSFRTGGRGEGEGGVTVAELKV